MSFYLLKDTVKRFLRKAVLKTLRGNIPESETAWRLNSTPTCTQCNSELNGVMLVKKIGLRS